MCAALAELRMNIEDVAPQASPSDINTAIVMMNACQRAEYAMTKHILNQSNDLTSTFAVKRLRSVE